MASKAASTSSANPKSSLRGVVTEVTKEKLAWLENQRKALKAHYASILEKYEKPENKASLAFIKEIHETLKKCPDGDNPAINVTKDLSVLLNWIDPKDPDAMIYFGNKQLVQDTIDVLVTDMKNQIEKCEYSCMYANAMTQYMDCNNGEDALKLEGDEDARGGEGDSKSNDKKETIEEFTKRVFSAPSPDGFNKDAFEKLLNESLFNMDDPAEKKQLLEMRREIRYECQYLFDMVGTYDVKLTIAGLIQEDLLGREKTSTLKELKENEAALTEVCTLLNKRLKNYNTWSWPAPVVVNFKRNLAGRYRAYMDEDILTAILLHFIGAKWNIIFKRWFKQIYNSKVWKRGTGTVGDLYYSTNSIEGYRREFHEQSFLSVLPNSMDDLATSLAIYDDEHKGASRPQTRGRTSVSRPRPKGRTASTATELTPMQTKQQLLHIISNEIHLNNALRPGTPLTVVQTDMEWFGPSLVHDIVLSLMKYFGVTDEWLGFFKTFLQAPMKVAYPNAPVQTRKRGAPISHQLTTLFGESLLFTMDLYVNRESRLSVYRIHDDFWFWSHDPERVTKAWNAMQTFTKVAGLTMNEEKSASIVCKSDIKDDKIIMGPEPLPQKNVQWGFVILHSDGVFRISDELLAPHVKEMRAYLEKAESVMSWIHGHNRYIHFFIRNFAEPALTFQKQHVVQIMEKLRSILKQVHPAINGDAVEALKLKYGEIFKGKDVMDSWVHWPVESGGLNLYNPFLDLIPLHEAYRKKEEQQSLYGYDNPRFGSVFNSDKTEWDGLVEESKERRKKRAQHTPHTTEELDEGTISDDEAYSGIQEDLKNGTNVAKREKRIDFETRCHRYRENNWGRWRYQYCDLLKNLDPVLASYIGSWKESLYTDQIEGELGYGASKFVDDNLVPLSLISSMQAERVHKN